MKNAASNRTLTDFENIIHRFREAMEADYVKSRMPSQSFPAGACLETCILLAYYLKIKGFGNFHYVLGENSKQQTHAWLENDVYLIDITGDQFPECNIKAVVKPLSETDGSHMGFKESVRNIAALNAIVGINFYNIIKAFEYVESSIEKKVV